MALVAKKFLKMFGEKLLDEGQNFLIGESLSAAMDLFMGGGGGGATLEEITGLIDDLKKHIDDSNFKITYRLADTAIQSGVQAISNNANALNDVLKNNQNGVQQPMKLQDLIKNFSHYEIKEDDVTYRTAINNMMYQLTSQESDWCKQIWTNMVQGKELVKASTDVYYYFNPITESFIIAAFLAKLYEISDLEKMISDNFESYCELLEENFGNLIEIGSHFAPKLSVVDYENNIVEFDSSSMDTEKFVSDVNEPLSLPFQLMSRRDWDSNLNSLTTWITITPNSDNTQGQLWGNSNITYWNQTQFNATIDNIEGELNVTGYLNGSYLDLWGYTRAGSYVGGDKRHRFDAISSTNFNNMNDNDLCHYYDANLKQEVTCFKKDFKGNPSIIMSYTSADGFDFNYISIWGLVDINLPNLGISQKVIAVSFANSQGFFMDLWQQSTFVRSSHSCFVSNSQPIINQQFAMLLPQIADTPTPPPVQPTQNTGEGFGMGPFGPFTPTPPSVQPPKNTDDDSDMDFEGGPF